MFIILVYDRCLLMEQNKYFTEKKSCPHNKINIKKRKIIDLFVYMCT